MSRLLVSMFMGATRAVVQSYTVATLPFYAAAQRPWRRLKLSKDFGVKRNHDKYGRVVYTRPCPVELNHPYLKHDSFNEIMPILDRGRRAVGYRKVLSEDPQLDGDGKPIKIDGKELKKITLAKEYSWMTVGECMEKVDAFARGLTRLGVGSGEKVIIYADNSLEWFFAALALIRLNATTVTLLSILNNDGICYGINQSEAKYIITSQDLLHKLDQIKNDIPNLKKIIYIPDELSPREPESLKAITNLESKFENVTTFENIIADGKQMPEMVFPIPKKDDIALIMYTSGTSGAPKGVMLTVYHLVEALRNILRLQEEMHISLTNTAYAGYLPMAHLYGYLLNVGCFVSDSTLAFCSPMTMLDHSPAHIPGQIGDFSLLKPQFIASVPLVLDRIQREIYRKLESRTPISAPIFTYLMDYKIRWTQRGFDTPIVNKLISSKINSQFGGNLQIMMVGSAPLSVRSQSMIKAALNVDLLQGYGCTECTAVSHGMLKPDLGYGECGVPMHSTKLYLKDWPEGNYHVSDKPNSRGEIVLGGATIAKGYYKMPKETAEAFIVDQDGETWFETGDIGEMLPNGTLKIIDRKKDLTKLPNGEFVSLGKIEASLRSNQYVENICVCVNPFVNYVVALISPNRKSLEELATKLHKPLNIAQLCQDPDIKRIVEKSIIESSKGLGLKKMEVPKKFELVKEEWTQDNDLLTAAFKLKRRQVLEYYKKDIEQLFKDQ